MTDKQIIIDGVNVKGCKRRIGKDNYCRYYKRPCSENNYNCVWKKYLRKEQECEELKKDLNEGCLQHLTLMTEQRVLLKTLAEIKEIAEKQVKRVPDGETFARPEIKQILQKISEVEK